MTDTELIRPWKPGSQSLLEPLLTHLEWCYTLLLAVTLNLSKVFISFYKEEGGQENTAIIPKSNFLLQKNGKMIQTDIEAHKRKKWNSWLFAPVE